ncbi:MAG TPA: 50S ribosomal protein L18 [Candidatus Paceibacterota bacterium]|nr:50S ribosomal protein L18 [Candidatus Paceibacterota bacterium]HOV88603.1 50S ribosomal protein L18 [Candidatus Paceibacterota bacterium]
MKQKRTKKEKRIRRHKKIRAKVTGTRAKPRVSVFVSNRHIYAQAIDDTKGVTLASVSDHDLKKKGKKSEVSKEIGLNLANQLKKMGIKTVVFDRGGFKFHGRVKNIAEGLREGGIKC